jgi:TRAP-type C4-dicarboxylate transport system permease small subunit
LYRAGSVTSRSFARVLHVLWLEVTGFFFLFLAFVGAAAGVREYHRHLAGTAGTGKIYLAAAFALIFAYFGVTSFMRSRRRTGK